VHLGKKIAVVVPAFNEETQICVVIDTMPACVDKIVIINDRSTDSTESVVKSKMRSKNNRVKLLNHETNQGVGAAIATGYAWCRDNDFDLVAVMAGDAQMNPNDLTNLLTPVALDYVDYSKGNRLHSIESIKKIPKVRLTGNIILSFLTKLVSGYWNIADSQTGYTVINKKALQKIDWDKMYKRYGQPNDLLVTLNIHGMRVVDIPIDPVYGVGEKSGIKIPTVMWTIGTLLIRLFFRRMKVKYIIQGFHPLVLFYMLGFLSIILGTLSGIRVLTIWLSQGFMPEVSLLLTIFMLLIAFNSFFFGMLFDYQENRQVDLKYTDLPEQTEAVNNN
jgi:glycosyltransferase involved in cell wall biosynthesis